METETQSGSTGGTARKARSPWLWLGCGCGVVALAAGLAITGFVYLIYRQVDDAKAARKNPELMARRVQTVAPYHDLPAPYRPVLSFSIPFLLRLALFADREPISTDPMSLRLPPEARSFTVVKTLGLFGARERRRRPLAQPVEPPPGWLKSIGVNIRTAQELRAGTFELDGHNVSYKTIRAHVLARGENVASLTSVMVIDCPDTRWTHLAIWTTPDPAPDQPLDAAHLAGTPADPASIEQMAGHFDLCGGR